MKVVFRPATLVYSNASGAMAETLNHPLAQHINRLNRIRRAVPALQKGQYSVQDISGDGMTYKRRFTDVADGVWLALITVSAALLLEIYLMEGM